jgi:hypothetical protein
VPCHYIPLNTDGDTIEELELQDNQTKIEQEVIAWLRRKITEIEEERDQVASVLTAERD